ncbi:MAG: hypothetical protein ABSD27_09650 [Bryobacteraceae bacterium]|jgi:hypothetical protein
MKHLSDADRIRAIAAFWFAQVNSQMRQQLMTDKLEIWETEIGIPRSILEAVREGIIGVGTCYPNTAKMMMAFCPDPPCGKILSPANMNQILKYMLEVAGA